jgi:uncharacterized protein (TIGR02246 family)
MMRTGFALVAALSLASALSAHAQDEPDADAVRSSYMDAFNGNDAKALAALFAEDAVLMPPDSDRLVGREAAEAHYTEFFGAAKPSGLAIEPQGTERLGDVLVDEGQYSLSATGPGGQTLAIKGDYLAIMRQGEDGKWLISRHIWNQDTMGAPQ